MKKLISIRTIIITIGIAVMITIPMFLSSCESLNRGLKDIGSSVSGLDRELIVYSSDGKEIQKFSGKFDIEETEYGNKIKFELNGKRIIIYNAIVVVREK